MPLAPFSGLPESESAIRPAEAKTKISNPAWAGYKADTAGHNRGGTSAEIPVGDAPD